MVEDVDGVSGARRGMRGGLLLALLGLTGIANACGGRTVWVEEGPIGGDAGESGNGGRGGYAGDYGGGYAGDYGGGYAGTSYGGAYGGSYAGTSYGGAYGGSNAGTSYGGSYAGTSYGGAYGGSYAGTAGYGGDLGGTAGTGYGGTGKGGFAGTAGMAGKGGCGASSGTGGGGGSPGLGKACAAFCPRFPYQSCTSDFDGPRDCLAKCQNGFNLGAWCQYALVDFLYCASDYLNPNAQCNDQDGACYGPGCTIDAVNNCAYEYVTLLECQDTPRPLPPCPPPPNPPLPPNCGQGEGVGPDYCVRETQCPGASYSTECYYQYDSVEPWFCECSVNGSYFQSATPGNVANPCQAGAAICGLY